MMSDQIKIISVFGSEVADIASSLTVLLGGQKRYMRVTKDCAHKLRGVIGQSMSLEQFVEACCDSVEA